MNVTYNINKSVSDLNEFYDQCNSFGRAAAAYYYIGLKKCGQRHKKYFKKEFVKINCTSLDGEVVYKTYSFHYSSFFTKIPNIKNIIVLLRHYLTNTAPVKII